MTVVYTTIFLQSQFMSDIALTGSIMYQAGVKVSFFTAYRIKYVTTRKVIMLVIILDPEPRYQNIAKII